PGSAHQDHVTSVTCGPARIAPGEGGRQGPTAPPAASARSCRPGRTGAGRDAGPFAGRHDAGPTPGRCRPCRLSRRPGAATPEESPGTGNDCPREGIAIYL